MSLRFMLVAPPSLFSDSDNRHLFNQSTRSQINGSTVQEPRAPPQPFLLTIDICATICPRTSTPLRYRDLPFRYLPAANYEQRSIKLPPSAIKSFGDGHTTKKQTASHQRGFANGQTIRVVFSYGALLDQRSGSITEISREYAICA